VKDHIREMMTCWMKTIEVKVNKVGENDEGTVIDERFPTQVFPVIRGKGMEY